jgi:LPS export ABC transporter protein LptC
MTLKFIAKKQNVYPAVRNRALRHSRRVRWLRIAIPLGIAGLLITFWQQIKDYNHFQPQTFAGSAYKDITLKNQLLNATLRATDHKGNPVTIKAKKATQNLGDAVLESTESHLSMEGGQDMTITSEGATYHEGEKILEYNKDVTLKMADGVVIKTDQATLDLNAKGASSKHPIAGSGPQGSMKADQGFEWRENTLSLKGKSALTLN